LKKWLYRAILITLPIICVLAAWFYLSFVPIVSQAEGMTYYLRPGLSKKAFIADLAQKNIISFPRLFSLYAYLQHQPHLKTGEYLFPKGSTQVTVWQQVTEGKGLRYYPFTIIPGWTFVQLRQALAKADGLNHTTQSFTDAQIMQILEQPNMAAEGAFFPDTYYYSRGIADTVILKKALIRMENKLYFAWQQRITGLPYKNEYEALIAASLIEKEARLSSERPIIAGVLINRLQKNMLLQFDPTVIYGMGSQYTGKIHKADLQADTPYNTYVHKGLPPTPIAMPSYASIEAALHPEQHDYFYFVAKGDGSHQFSKTLLQHNHAVTVAATVKRKKEYFFNEVMIKQYIVQVWRYGS
jgi:UPF0755 protein